MTLCPVALAVGCKKCPVFAVCPLKSVIGDQGGDAAGGSSNAKDEAKPAAKRNNKAKSKSNR